MIGRKESNRDWFPDNLEAKLCNGAIPNCNACVFRDTKMCGRITCTYIDDANGILKAVYWVPKKTCANVAMVPGLVDYFATTSTCDILKISKAVLTKMVLEKQAVK